MYNMQVFSLVLLVATVHNIRCAENGQNHWISSHLATKTPYDSKRDDPFHESHEWIPANIPQGYKIEHIDVLYRHGTRYPSRQKLSIWWTELNSLNKIVGHEKLSEALKILSSF
uniref:Uncharacterized protein n=1 Tax=Ciona savignyi TaxID=51511 RepID=H2ZCE4_CIOSA